MKYLNIPIILTVILLISGCKKNIFGPNVGTLDGTITNTQGKALQNVKITATYLTDNSDPENPQYKNISTVTNENGYYKFDEILLVENQVATERTGLQPQEKFIQLTQKNNHQTLNFTLIGYPEITFVSLSKDTIYQASTDTATIQVNAFDEYNDNNSGNYTLSALFYNQNNELVDISELTKKSNSSSNFIFSGNIIAITFPAGTYSINLELTDSDNNLILEPNTQTIVVRP